MRSSQGLTLQVVARVASRSSTKRIRVQVARPPNSKYEGEPNYTCKIGKRTPDQCARCLILTSEAHRTQEVFIPDAAQFSQENIAFLSLQTDETTDQLCTLCTRQSRVHTTTNSSPVRPLCTAPIALSTPSVALPSSAVKYKLLEASQQAQHHARLMAALYLLARQLLPRPRVPLHFWRRKRSRRQDESMLGCRYVFMGLRGHSHLSFRYLYISL